MKNGQEDQWMTITLFYLKNVGGPFIIPSFYTDVLNAWAEVREQISDNEIHT